MVEIAICLAIIGIALVAIIGVLPLGINVQKDNRQETLVDQDATVFLNAIRNGARGLDDLTNYVLAITNNWTEYGANSNVLGVGTNGYTYTAASVDKTSVPYMALTNGANIIGLLSTPKYTDANNGLPISSLMYGGYSNHVVAYVRSLSGPAVEKPPQNNDIILGDSFGYKLICDNLPISHYMPPKWDGGTYNASPAAPVNVSFTNLDGQITYWQTTSNNTSTIPGESPWMPMLYPQELDKNSHELRLTFLWPLLPNGSTGNGRHTFATTVAGKIDQTNVIANGPWLYFFQPQSFTSAP